MADGCPLLVSWSFGMLLRKCVMFTLILKIGLTVYFVNGLSACINQTVSKVCAEGDCVNGTCICFPGWAGEYCHECNGRISLHSREGVIYDGADSYSKDLMCSWLLDMGKDSGNTTVRFVFNSFATECGWDHLYVHDGDSAFQPLLAAYSGLLLSPTATGSSYEVSFRFSRRYAYLHFYSDAAYTMAGFNITYSVDGCYLGCSGQGQCINGSCHCVDSRSGRGCEVDLTLCLNNCSENGVCRDGLCHCNATYRGADCSLGEGDMLWERESTVNAPSGRASHVAIVEDVLMWVIGGYSLADTGYNRLVTYNLSSRVWMSVMEMGTDSPWPLYGHSAVMFQNKLYLYGGVQHGIVKGDLWVFDLHSSSWLRRMVGGYPVSGHTAHVYNGTMLVFFGYSPVFGYVNRVQRYHFDTGEWSVVDTSGSRVQGGYGHASVYDYLTDTVYIHGGYHSRTELSTPSSSYNLTDVLYAYSARTNQWVVLYNSGYPRYLHSMVMMTRYLLVFGGNTHNDTSKSRGARCFSSDFMLYDISCNTWNNLTVPTVDSVARFGHSMVTWNGDLYMFGGFNSVMLNDVLRISLGRCDAHQDNSSCVSSVAGARCVWNSTTLLCHMAGITDSCHPSTGDVSICPGYNTCTSCLAAEDICAWCGGNCTALNCTSTDKVSALSGQCETQDTGCHLYHTCQACQDDTRCMWDTTNCKVRTGAAVNMSSNMTDLQAVCSRTPCASYTGCDNCTNNSCMWCSNLAVCIDTNAYVAAFPYGQCQDWTTKDTKCAVTRCSGLKSCTDCLANSRCGWCNDVANTGLGVCMEGGQLGPLQGTMGLSAHQCPSSRWFFTQCPKCQCNGHSTCSNNSSTCEECEFPTTGIQCQYCQHFYYGNPVHGGNCTECECNGQADACNHETGQCYCRTRGVTGDHCDRCDDVHKYFGDPKNGGTCYYKLSTDYQYTFNLSKTDDKNYTQINFLSIPGSGDRDVDFTLNCSGFALLNITFKSKTLAEEQWITVSHECDYFRSKFEHKDYAFGGDYNSTFFVYVYGFKTPFWLQISFSQFPKIDLVHFFITFFSCFLSLLLIAAALWKIKHKYDSYRRRQQLMVEMQQMASRPFSSVCVEVEKKGEVAAGGGVPERKELKDHVDTALRRRKKLSNKPSAIAIEPLAGHKAAVLTLLIQLPFGDGEFAPSGQSGMAVGSALVSMGTIRKQSLEHLKGDKPKIRKHLLYTHPDTFA